MAPLLGFDNADQRFYCVSTLCNGVGGHNYVRVYNTWNFSATSTRLYESIKHFSLLSSVIDQVQLLLLLLSLSLPQLLRAGKDVLVSFHPVFSHDFRGGLHTFESAFAPCLYVYLNLVFVHPHFPFPKCSAPSTPSVIETHISSFASLLFGLGCSSNSI